MLTTTNNTKSISLMTLYSSMLQLLKALMLESVETTYGTIMVNDDFNHISVVIDPSTIASP